jgi:hypothetical protein
MSITREILNPLMQRDFDLNETMAVLTHNKIIYFTWGVSKKYNVDSKGLLLKVNGHHHKGYIFITLTWEDLYNVHLISTHGNIKESIEGIYFDQLTEIIDNKIERIPQYQK